MSDDLNAMQTIEKAFLAAASPETVYSWLKERAPKAKFDVGFNEELLQALRERGEPLIDLALSQFSTSREVLKGLFDSGGDEIRCAALSNRRLGDVFWTRGGEQLLLAPAEYQAFVQEAPPRELEALLSNPSLPQSELEALFLRKPPYDAVEEERWMGLIFYAAENTRLHHPHDPDRHSMSDGWADYQHSKLIETAWGLLDRVPATERWAALLRDVYSLIAYAGAPRRIESVPDLDSSRPAMERAREFWEQRVVPTERAFFTDVFAKWSSAEVTADEHDAFSELRQVVASKAPKSVEGLIRDHEDRFVRMGYYRQFQPWEPSEVQQAYERDSRHFLEAAVENGWFYQWGHLRVRLALHGLIYNNNAPSGWHTDFLRHQYESNRERAEAKDPRIAGDWEDESLHHADEVEERARQRPATRLSAIAESVARHVPFVVKDSERAVEVVRATDALKDALDAIEERYTTAFAESVQGLRALIEGVGRAQKSNRALTWWTIAIGLFIVVLLITR